MLLLSWTEWVREWETVVIPTLIRKHTASVCICSNRNSEPEQIEFDGFCCVLSRFSIAFAVCASVLLLSPRVLRSPPKRAFKHKIYRLKRKSIQSFGVNRCRNKHLAQSKPTNQKYTHSTIKKPSPSLRHTAVETIRRVLQQNNSIFKHARVPENRGKKTRPTKSFRNILFTSDEERKSSLVLVFG